MKALALFALLVGCAPAEPHYRVVVDPSVDATGLIEAADEWRALAPGLELTVETGDARAVMGDPGVIAVLPWDCTRDVAGVTHTFNPSRHDGGWIMIRPGFERSDVPAHELGHAFGLQHTDAGLMRSAAPPQRQEHVTCAEVRAYCAVWGISPCGCGT